jgi:COP9 signalosome complex subunit 1
MYLASHVDVLCKEIRSRAMIQYFYPYLSVDLHQMAQAFLTDPLVLEKEICDLISTGKIDARLDSFQKVLYSHQSNKRQVTYKHALEVGRNHVAESRNLLLRMSLIKNNVIVRQVK